MAPQVPLPSDPSIADRDLSKLDPRFLYPFLAWKQAAEDHMARVDQGAGRAPASIVPHEARRTMERQEYLYSFGRYRPGPEVTWTKKSTHRLGLAVDWHFERHNAAIWDSSSYAWIYRAVPPEDFGLEILSTPEGRVIEWVHLQWRGATALWDLDLARLGLVVT